LLCCRLSWGKFSARSGGLQSCGETIDADFQLPTRSISMQLTGLDRLRRERPDLAALIACRMQALGRVLGVVSFLALGLALSPSSAKAVSEQVSFCHRTASVNNPYNLITTDADSIVRAGHGGHDGPIFPNEGPDGKSTSSRPSTTRAGTTPARTGPQGE
jgi:hypothetical protein